jgi:hypothetical protein
MSTLHPRMFIAQSTIEAWLDSGLAVLGDQRVELLARRATYALVPAVRFVAVVGDGPAAALVGRVLAEARVMALGGELVGSSVVLGDTAFEVEPGWIGTLEGGQGS